MLGLYSLVLTRRAKPHMAEISRLIEADKARFFPSHFDFDKGGKCERRPLLDDLVEVMENYVGCGACTSEAKGDDGKGDGEVGTGMRSRTASHGDGIENEKGKERGEVSPSANGKVKRGASKYKVAPAPSAE